MPLILNRRKRAALAAAAAFFWQAPAAYAGGPKRQRTTRLDPESLAAGAKIQRILTTWLETPVAGIEILQGDRLSAGNGLGGAVQQELTRIIQSNAAPVEAEGNPAVTPMDFRLRGNNEDPDSGLRQAAARNSTAISDGRNDPTEASGPIHSHPKDSVNGNPIHAPGHENGRSVSLEQLRFAAKNGIAALLKLSARRNNVLLADPQPTEPLSVRLKNGLRRRLASQGLSWDHATNRDTREIYRFVVDERARFGIDPESIPFIGQARSMDNDLLKIDAIYSGQSGEFAVIRRDGKVVSVGGWTRQSPDTAVLTKFYTAPQEQGRRIARDLVLSYIQEIGQRGYRIIVLYTNELFKNKAFWEAFGFRQYTNGNGHAYQGSDVDMVGFLRREAAHWTLAVHPSDAPFLGDFKWRNGEIALIPGGSLPPQQVLPQKVLANNPELR